MNIYGKVESLKVIGKEDYWNSPNLFFFSDDELHEVSIYFEEVCPPLIEYLTDKSTEINESFSEKRREKAHRISLSELKLKLCVEMKSLIDKEKNTMSVYARYKFCEQLEALIKRINMIAELGDLTGKEIFLRFCLV